MRCLGWIRGEMVSVMTTHLPSTLVAYASGKLCEHLTAAQAPYPASISSCDLRPKPTFDPARTFAPCRESWAWANDERTMYGGQPRSAWGTPDPVRRALTQA
jgi:hypothetical protein